MAAITDRTSTDEVSAVQLYYTTDTGTVDYDAIATAIQNNDTSAGYDVEDLITAYLEGTGTLPEYMMSPEAFISNPEEYSWLWDEDVITSLQQLGDLHSSDATLLNAINDFIAYGPQATTTAEEVSTDSTSSGLSEIETFLSQELEMNEEESKGIANEVFNLFNTSDLSDVMSLFISMGNPGVALLLYTAYALNPQARDLQDAALDVIDDSSDEMEDLMDQLQDIDPEDVAAQYDAQAISQQLSVVATTLQTMTEFIQTAQDVVDEMMRLASELSRTSNQTTGTIISNIV